MFVVPLAVLFIMSFFNSFAAHAFIVALAGMAIADFHAMMTSIYQEGQRKAHLKSVFAGLSATKGKKEDDQ